MAHLLKIKPSGQYLPNFTRLLVNSMSVSRSDVLKLYKNMLQESKKFPIYNYRMYALRKIRDSFRENRSLEDSNIIEASYEKGVQNLELIKRQVIVSSLYKTEKLVIE